MRPFPVAPLSCRVRPVQPGHTAHNLEIATIGVHTNDRGWRSDTQWISAMSLACEAQVGSRRPAVDLAKSRFESRRMFG